MGASTGFGAVSEDFRGVFDLDDFHDDFLPDFLATFFGGILFQI